MGKFHLGPDEQYTLQLRDAHGIDLFIETGTYKGATTRWAAQHFKAVGTIEAYAPRIKAWYDTPDNPANVTFCGGDSRVLLPHLLALADRPAILWLDAHWCGEGAHDSVDECPLAEELAAVNASKYAAKHVIMIDDARLFEASPPYPHDPAQWLTLDEIAALLGPGRTMHVDQDIIYGLPR